MNEYVLAIVAPLAAVVLLAISAAYVVGPQPVAQTREVVCERKDGALECTCKLERPGDRCEIRWRGPR